MKGIILAGGTGSRLYPSTVVTSKHLLAVFDKPMIYYPLSTLMFAGIKDILIISTPLDTPKYEEILKDGSSLGIKISYKIQKKPDGIAQSLIIGKDFIENKETCLILGDNIFYGDGLINILRNCGKLKTGSIIFGYYVKNPKSYGIVEIDENAKPISIEEKPSNPKSNFAIPGLYFFDKDVASIAQNIKPSKRGELEITDILFHYLKENNLKVELIGRGTAWLDAGTPENLLEASNFISIIEKRQGLKIACIEEIAYRMGFINKNKLSKIITELPKCTYKDYLYKLINNKYNNISIEY